MDKKLPIYDLTLADVGHGMFKISLVDKPAIEEDFVYFSKEEVIQYFADEEKREVVGPIMIPNKEIVRFSPEHGYYYIRFTEEVIREIMYRYSKDGFFNKFGIHHEYDTDDVVMLEVWMKESENDKSKDYGYDLPNGTVFVKAKVESDELFSEIKDGRVNGFSIEIKADMKPTINNEEQMNEFAFAKELGKMEASMEATIAKFEAQITALEEDNATLLEALTSLEEKFGGVEDLKGAIEMIQKHIESMGASQEEEKEMESNEDEEKEEEMSADKPEKNYAPAGEKAIDMTEKKEEEVYEATEETTEEVTEEFEAEEEVNETEVEEQFAAEQKAEEAEETVEDKTVNFNGITAEKVNMVNSFFNKFN